MTALRFIWLGATLAALCSCAGVDTARPSALSGPNQVASSQEGDRVRVTGYLLFESHARQLWSSPQAITRNDIANCVTLVNTERHRRRLAERSRSVLTIVGRPIRDVMTGYIDLGACNRVGLYVERVE